jgi:N-acetylgalactosamine-N,N'-diacetylbacillosaminyl-diphospho-undecaprenol 4-alpha-N-acetylgalactosaminyltransferase
LDGNKNQELIIRAYNESKIKWNYSLYILWEGEKREYLNDLIKSLHLEWKVKLLWYQKNPYKYLANASLFCFASKSESFWLVLLEALLLSLPIITTPIPSANEILLWGKLWLVVKDYSSKWYIQGLNEIYENYNSFKYVNGYSYVKNNFSVKKMIKQYEHYINSL